MIFCTRHVSRTAHSLFRGVKVLGTVLLSMLLLTLKAKAQDPGVTTYIDGVPQLNAHTSSIEIIDVDQIEFVRGPQRAFAVRPVALHTLFVGAACAAVGTRRSRRGIFGRGKVTFKHRLDLIIGVRGDD
jgi:hypothetical protein